MKFVAVLLVIVATALAQLRFTGDADRDFLQSGALEFPVVVVEDPSGLDAPDVGVPDQVLNGESIVSGWDMRQILFLWNPEADTLSIGIDCFVICGDADGRLGPDVSSPQLLSIGGEDTENLSGQESFALSIDFDRDGSSDVIMGVPGGDPALGEPLEGCSTFASDDCFGIFRAIDFEAVAPAFRFGSRVPGAVITNENPRVSAERPDLEWRIEGLTALRENEGGVSFEESPFEAWSFNMNAFAGSFVDSGVGEDYIPNQRDFVEVPFPCLQFDDCDVCLGDGSSCVDCLGVPNGNADYDACGVCGGDGTSCADCLGVPFGTAVYDACGICGGNGNSCLDCLGNPNGQATYDACGVCAGDGSTCLDCNGVPNGRAFYDVCDVCGGDGRACLDCAGIPFGNAVRDVCGVCNGDGTSCLDCAGVPNGGLRYDKCGICGGDGSSCEEECCCPTYYHYHPVPYGQGYAFAHPGDFFGHDDGYGHSNERHHVTASYGGYRGGYDGHGYIGKPASHGHGYGYGHGGHDGHGHPAQRNYNDGHDAHYVDHYGHGAPLRYHSNNGDYDGHHYFQGPSYSHGHGYGHAGYYPAPIKTCSSCNKKPASHGY